MKIDLKNLPISCGEGIVNKVLISKNKNIVEPPSPLGERVGERGCKAFTLAEVLITLGVIGVVAAMTMPTVIKKYQEQVTVNKVKKIYSTLKMSMKCLHFLKII